MNLSRTQVTDFRSVILDYYQQHGRHDMPWRRPEADGSFDAYKILVSELMLQQTQVARVIPKFNLFMELFPTVEALADASLAAVLTAWSGLGYNRRAKFLHQAAKLVVTDFNAQFPQTLENLVRLPGVGANTAGAIMAYAFNQPVMFIETNIRTVYIHHFFSGRGVVGDSELLPYLQATIDIDNPREWYWALMDYGAFLKSAGVKLNKLSKHYTQQSTFEGSARQIRGQVIRSLSLQPITAQELSASIPDPRLASILSDLQYEGLIAELDGIYTLSD